MYDSVTYVFVHKHKAAKRILQESKSKAVHSTSQQRIKTAAEYNHTDKRNARCFLALTGRRTQKNTRKKRKKKHLQSGLSKPSFDFENNSTKPNGCSCRRIDFLGNWTFRHRVIPFLKQWLFGSVNGNNSNIMWHI